MRKNPDFDAGGADAHQRNDRRRGPRTPGRDDALRAPRGPHPARHLSHGRPGKPAASGRGCGRHRPDRVAVRPQDRVRGLPGLPTLAPPGGTGSHGGPAVAVPHARAVPGRRRAASEPAGVHAGARRHPHVEFARGQDLAPGRRAAVPIASVASGSWAGGSASSWRPTCACSCGCCGRAARWWGKQPERRVLDSLEISRRDVLCLFDYRRYQQDTIAAGKVAAERGAVVIVFTDPWLSPAVEYGAARADLARGLGVAVRLAARCVRAHRADRRQGGGGARRSGPDAGCASSRRCSAACTNALATVVDPDAGGAEAG